MLEYKGYFCLISRIIGDSVLNVEFGEIWRKREMGEERRTEEGKERGRKVSRKKKKVEIIIF